MKVKEAIFVPTNFYGREIKPLPWQIEAGRYENLIIVAPTGAGKSVASYIWAGQKPTKRVIFTAPTKSLSNERWLELKVVYLIGLNISLTPQPKVCIPSLAQRYKDIPVGNLFPWEVCQSIF